MMHNPNPDLSIEFISISGETLHKISNLKDLRCLYYSWSYIFGVKIRHIYSNNNPEEVSGNYCSNTKFIFNNISYSNFSILIYHILTESTIGANNIVTVIKSSEEIYESKYLYENDCLNFGIRLYLRRL